VVIGGGFAGLQAARALAQTDADVTLVDRNNYHLFQPLSYQVATGALSPAEIAMPLRTVFRDDPRVQVVMADVTGIDLQARRVDLRPAAEATSEGSLAYDELIVASGSQYAYFGHDDWRSVALEVKTLDSAVEVRGRLLAAFEAAELTDDPAERARWLTFVVIGGGPTGVEMAGQIAELARDTLAGEFRRSDPQASTVILVEMADRVLGGFAPALSDRARRSLEQLGVSPLLGHAVVDVRADAVDVRAPDGEIRQIPTRTVVWAAGVTASPLARVLADASGAEVDRAGRIIVGPDLTVPGHPEVLAIGDMAVPRDPATGQPTVFPGVAPVAMQQGRYAGRLVADRLAGRATPPFHYRDKGALATIGRGSAVAQLRALHVSGLLAWVIWLVVHLFYLIGFQNRLLVLLRWSYSFLTHGRGSRLITREVALGDQPADATQRPADRSGERRFERVRTI
jgi:NADH dehydrogenase